MKRRDFLRLSAAGAAGFVAASGRNNPLWPAEEPSKKAAAKWYKGNIHAHSQWSDGKDLPEIVVDAYKKRNYDFFCLSDHNIIQSERLRFDGFAMNYTPNDKKPFEGKTSFWKKVVPAEGWPNLTEAHLQAARDRFGSDSVETLEADGNLYARMKTYAELNAQFGEPGKFLLLPGFEMTSPNLHVNLINVEEDFYLDDPDFESIAGKSLDRAREIYGGKNRPWIMTVNHPLWQYYNIQPSTLIARPDLRHIELTNNNTDYGLLPGAWTPESFWDVVNAYRAAHGEAPLYATGTDDSHGVFRTDYLPFHGWMYVRSNELSAAALFDAMNRGDSYCSTGLELADVSFDGKTLAVKIAPRAQGEYRIEFVGTKKDYDGTAKTVDRPAEGNRPARKIEMYSPEIGRVLETADGLAASYTLKPDDLYVRAKAFRVGAGNVVVSSNNDVSPLANDAAWTQPYQRG